MADSIPVPPFEPLSPLEREMDAALRSASHDKTRGLVVGPTQADDKSVRVPFLLWLLLEAIPAVELPIARFELRDADITDELDLSGTKLAVLPRFANCRFGGAIKLEEAEIIGFEMIAGSAFKISADRLTATGSLLVRAANPDDGYPSAGQLPEIERRIRLCGAKIHGNLDLSGCRLHGQIASGKLRVPLFADGLTVEGNLVLGYGFTADGEIRLNGCDIHRNLDCSGAHLRNLVDDAAHNPAPYTLSAAGAHIAGSMYICRTPAWLHEPVDFVSTGTLRLEGAKIDGDLDCTGGLFKAKAFADENWSHATGANNDLYAIKADGIDVGGDIKLLGAFHARGIVDLTGAKIEGDFNCKDGFFDFPGEDALCADGITVSGSTSLYRSSADNDRITTNGILRFPLASFKQGFFVNGALFDVNGSYRNWLRGSTTAGELNCPGRGICGIFAPLAEVNGKFRWREIEKPAPHDPHNQLWLHLEGSKADAIDDHKEAWQRLDRFEVSDCDYKSILHLAPDVVWRSDELDRQYAILNPRRNAAAPYGPVARLVFFIKAWCVAGRALARALFRWLPSRWHEDAELANAVKAFSPQPYIQLAKAVRAAGYEKAANDVLVRLERNRTRYSDFSVLRQLGRWTLDLVLLYGFSPFRPILYVVVAVVISAGFFEKAHDECLIVAASDNASACKPTAAGTATGDGFNALVYATDTLVPLVNLNQKKNWVVAAPPASTGAAPEPPRSWWQGLVRAWAGRPRGLPGLLVIFNTFFGWLMTTLFAAGVTGLVRGGGESD